MEIQLDCLQLISNYMPRTPLERAQSPSDEEEALRRQSSVVEVGDEEGGRWYSIYSWKVRCRLGWGSNTQINTFLSAFPLHH
jgi:hypothetical protein